ncbi:unnamed protein product [Brugia pahangi]|uniref:TSC22 domain family protein 4 n=1 Tax=Brugia pahangi TaxID=6280 RepID=A0A0N4TVP8_BRUPA|nr:unnamed protein product [Brugia pahangi]
MVGRVRRSSLRPDGNAYQTVKSSDYHHLRSIQAKRRNRRKYLVDRIYISGGYLIAFDRLCLHFSSPAGGTVVAASGTGANTIIAIDGKIEQAMDLVKTHLMFAVREEVDVLRAKIMELEATILQLEAENTILREHVPVEILNKLSLQTTSPNSTTTAAAV